MISCVFFKAVHFKKSGGPAGRCFFDPALFQPSYFIPAPAGLGFEVLGLGFELLSLGFEVSGLPYDTFVLWCVWASRFQGCFTRLWHRSESGLRGLGAALRYFCVVARLGFEVLGLPHEVFAFYHPGGGGPEILKKATWAAEARK